MDNDYFDGEATVYDNSATLPFIADRLAEVDALVTFLVESIRCESSYSGFRHEVKKQLKEVKLDQIIDINKWLAEQKSGFVAIVKDLGPDNYTVDYYRDDNGLPVIFPSLPFLEKTIPPNLRIEKTIDLSTERT